MTRPDLDPDAAILADLRERHQQESKAAADAFQVSDPDALQAATVREAMLGKLLRSYTRGPAGDALARIERAAEERGRRAGVVEERARVVTRLRQMGDYYHSLGIDAGGTIHREADAIERGATAAKEERAAVRPPVVPDTIETMTLGRVFDDAAILPSLAPGFEWTRPDECGYVALRWRGQECYGSQVQATDAEGIQRVLNEHAAKEKEG
jgi:hypothetical protein